MKSGSGSVLMLMGASLCGALVSYAMFQGPHALLTHRKSATPPAAPARAAQPCEQLLVRMPGYRYVHHLLAAGTRCESPRLAALQDRIAAEVGSLRNQGRLTSASVYVRDFRNGDWTCFNGAEVYSPGSLMKVPLMVAAFVTEERSPGFLDKVVRVPDSGGNARTAHFTSEQVVPGGSCSTRDLVRRMIIHSDDLSKSALQNVLPKDQLAAVLTHVGLAASVTGPGDHGITAPEYSVVLSSLFNSADLSPMDADKALGLLTETDIERGLVAGVGPGIPVAHNFGESGSRDTPEFHDAGIVYASNGPYLITIMTKGTDIQRLPEAVADISKVVYEWMTASGAGTASR